MVGQKDWVFLPNQQYRRAEDVAFVMTTNSSGMVDLTYVGSSLENSFSQIAAAQWTGLNSDWTTWKSAGVPVTCNTSKIDRYGVYGVSNSKDSNALKEESSGTFVTSCSNKFTSYGNYRLGLVCVEQ